MIIALLLNIIYYVLYALAYVFLLANDVVVDPNIAGSMTTAIGYARALNELFPITEFFTVVISLFLLYESGYLLLKIFNWVIRKIPGIS